MNNPTLLYLSAADVRGALVRDCSDDETVPVKVHNNTPCGTEVVYEFESFSEDDRTSDFSDTLVTRLIRKIRQAQ